VFPIAEIAKIGRELGVPLIVDNTAAPVLCQPIKHGAAVSMLSTTKYVGGHGTSIGGIIVDGGNFDWEKHADRFPMLNTPDPSYHGAVWTQAVKPLGPIAYIIKARVTLLRDVGAAMSPFNAFLFIQGLETLPLRMREHCRNAEAVAAYLVKHPKITKVIYPSLMAGEAKRRAEAYLGGRYGALVGFELRGGAAAGRNFIEALKMLYHVANIGDARDPSGIDDALAAFAPGAGANRRFRRLCPPVDRHRAHRRHHCGPRSGAGKGLRGNRSRNLAIATSPAADR
jgi:O-acetylhomoserine (thiol)-lyase